MMFRPASIGLAILVLTACGEDHAAVETEVAVQPVVVYPAPVRQESIVDPILATGEVRADKTTALKPRVDGLIEAIFVRVGDRVKQGDPLFRMRQTEYASRARELEQAVTLAQAELTQTQRDLDRAEPLREKGVVSQGHMDTVLTQHAMAEARLGIAQATLARARQDLADTVVEAPYDGLITGRFLDEGTMVQVMSSNTPVVEIVKADIVEVVAQIPATHLSRVASGSHATVTIDGLSEPVQATLDVINDKIDARTRSIEVRLRIDNKDLAIKPGLFARVALYPEPRSTIVVNRAAVLGIAGDNYVFIPEGKTARRQAVDARDLDAGLMEVLGGLTPGDIALAGPNLPDVSDGTPIELRQELHGAR